MTIQPGLVTSKKCCRSNCQREAKLVVILVCPIIDAQRKISLEMVLEKYVCVEHSKTDEVSAFVSGSDWRSIVKGFRGRRMIPPQLTECGVKFAKFKEKKKE
jgi:hypothetical protein